MQPATNPVDSVTNQEGRSPSVQPLTNFPLVMMVGLTGVGKTTIIELLQQQLNLTLLPNRRQVTDEVMIAPLQQEDGHTPYPVTDRVKRFEYTARYRTKYPGGMAYALGQLAINPMQVEQPLIFDGLRGLHEVQFAADYFPQARFILLDASDVVRLGRLLNRADAFDATRLETLPAAQNLVEALMSVPHISGVFNDVQIQQIVRLASDIPIDDVIQKATIVVKERLNYDPHAARAYLITTLPAERVLVVDAATASPLTIAKQVSQWLAFRRTGYGNR